MTSKKFLRYLFCVITALSSITAFSQSNPQIYGVFPTSGAPAGSRVRVSGAGFGDSQNGGSVTQNGVAVTATYWSDTSISFYLSANATTGPVVVTTGDGLSSNTATFTVIPPPTITSLSPGGGSMNSQLNLTINGTGFGSDSFPAQVTICNQNTSIVSWSDTQVVAKGVDGCSPGPAPVEISFWSGVFNTNIFNYNQVALHIDYFSPASAPVGTVIGVGGEGFGASQSGGSVSFNGIAASVVSWSDTSIRVSVPTGATTGPVTVSAGGYTSNAVTFTVIPQPTITSLSPSGGPMNSQVTLSINGTGFGSSSFAAGVTICSINASIVSWSDTQVVVNGVSGCSSGPAPVQISFWSGDYYSNTFNYDQVSLHVDQVWPTSGPIGGQIRVVGEGFGATQNGGSVSFNGITASVISWTDTSINVDVPNGATTGPVAVTAGGYTSNSVTFTVVPPPQIISLSPASGTLTSSSTITINGSGFTNSSFAATVTIGGTYAQINSWSDTAIVVTSPSSWSDPQLLPIQVNVSGVFPSNIVNFVVGNEPILSSISPSVLSPGMQLTLAGSGFGATQGAGYVSLQGESVQSVVSWTDTQIVLTVPADVIAGTVFVVQNGLTSNSLNFTVLKGLNTSRFQHNSTLLNNGKIVIAGGVNCATAGSCTYLSSAELYDPTTGTSNSTGSLSTPRAAPAVLLPNGKVLVAGGSTCDPFGNCFSLNSAEIYDPTAGTFSPAGNMQSARDGHTMTLLADGRVLIVGGEACVPGQPSGGGPTSRNNGEPLIGGGHLIDASFTPTASSITCNALTSAEIYDPTAGTFTLTSSLNTARYNAAATLLTNGKILVVGGSNERNPLNSAELYDPAAGSFTTSASAMGTARSLPVATLLNSGLVLISGGSTCDALSCPTNTVELYDPDGDEFQYSSANMNAPRVEHTATLLTNGQVLLAGGINGCQGTSCTSDGSTELYDPSTDSFSSSQALLVHRSGHTATLLTNGSVILAGGISTGATQSSVESYQPDNVTPVGLISIAVAPADESISVGGVQQYVATGTFSDGSTSNLASVIWSSSNSGVASISNASSDSGFAEGISFGSTTITATIGTISASATLNVQPPAQSASFSNTSGQMTSSVYAQTATRLLTGQVLATGGMGRSGVVNTAQLYNPTTGTFAAASSMTVARWLHTATLLNDGTVLIVGGSNLSNKETLDSAEIYNPATGSFTLLSSTLNTARIGQTATLLNNGQVLIVGGYDPDFGLISDAELYDPPTQTFIDIGDTNLPRYQHTATILQNGQVLITGGEAAGSNGAYNKAEIFDPLSQSFTLISVPMTVAREDHAAIPLNNGQVLIAGGNDPGSGPLNTAEIYDPTSEVFFPVTATMTAARISPEVTLLNGGQVLIVGGLPGTAGPALASTEIYDPNTQLFTAVGNMSATRVFQTDTLLNDGTVLISGGTDNTNILNSAELYVASQLNGLTSIAIVPVNPSIGLGAQQLFTAVGTFTDGSTETLTSVEWSSSSATTATLSNDATNSGVGVSHAQGTATVTASASGVSGSATLTITVPALVSIELSPQSPSIPLGATQQFTATGIYTDGSTQDLTSTVSWNSLSIVAGINSSGVAAGVFQGVGAIQASLGSITVSTNVDVGPPTLVSIAIDPSSATIALGTSQQYQAIGTYSDGSTQNVSGLLTWSSSAVNIATVNNLGLAQSTGQGVATVTGAYDALSVSVSLTVAPPSLVSIAVTPNAASLSAGSSQQLTAIGNYSDGTTQNLTSSGAWASSNPSVIGITNTGLVTASTRGEATVSVTLGSITGTATLVVTSGTTQANLNTGRYLHSATLLDNGQILIAGGINCSAAGVCTYLNSAEIYDPVSSSFIATGAMAQTRSAPAVLLNNGNVLIAGGYTCDNSGNCSSLGSAELYNPSTGNFSSTGSMTTARDGHTATLLSNGRVLIAGGENCVSVGSCTALNTAEIYDPVAGTFSPAHNQMNTARFGASAVLLGSGEVLIAGGFDGMNLASSAEIFDPTPIQFSASGPQLNMPRFNATATLLNNGKVLVAGGSTCALPGCPSNSAEIYDPGTNTFSLVSSGMNVSRFNHTATLLINGQVLLAGGYSSCSSTCISESTTELFDSTSNTFVMGPAETNAIAGQSGTLMANGNVLLVGGINNGVTLTADEWYQPTTLTPPNLVSIAVGPSTSFLMAGVNQQLVATGTFSDGSTEVLQSVVWNSSNPSVAMISNSSGSAGIVTALGSGETNITATAGNVGGSLPLSVGTLSSLSVAPANPTITVGASQQFTATATFTDGSTQDFSTSANWASSNGQSVTVGTVSGLQGLAIGTSAGTAMITATLGNFSANTLITVQARPTTPPAPNISSVTPTAGVGGTQVTISGSGFGNAQGQGTLWLGTNYANVLSWSDSQIVATVSTISQSGTVQVEQSGLLSNAIPFSVNNARITSVSPNIGVPGTQVVISGSNFGSIQGGGQVWLGTANAVVQSWSDTQIVADVALGSTSGAAQVLQNGVLSSPYPFTVEVPHITYISPNSGPADTVVTIGGTGFGGGTQCGGGGGGGLALVARASARQLSARPELAQPPSNSYVMIGGENAFVTAWCDTQITATVASGAVSGLAKVYADGVWSNAVSFTVTSGGNGQTARIVPGVISMAVGEVRSLQAFDTNNQPASGLNWSSSDPEIASLSTDDPPVITALQPGSVTIRAGNASADLTIYPTGGFPLGTVIWSNQGDGSGVAKIIPAVSSPTGVADTFALNNDCNAQAVTSMGLVGWTANVGTSATSVLIENGGQSTIKTTTACNQAVADFQGGLIAVNQSSLPDANGQIVNSAYIQRFDGLTGQAYPAYNLQNPTGNLPVALPHSDGTIFTLDGGNVVGIDPTSGSPKFTVQLPQSSIISTGQVCVYGPPNRIQSAASTVTLPATFLTQPIIAGDGYFYVVYTNFEETGNSTIIPPSDGGLDQCAYPSPGTGTLNVHYAMLRVGSSGDWSSVSLGDLNNSNAGYQSDSGNCPPVYNADGTVFTGGNIGISNTSGMGVASIGGGLLTDGDQGVVLSWTQGRSPYVTYSCSNIQGFNNVVAPGFYQTKVTIFNGGGISSDAVISSKEGTDISPEISVTPVLQRQDGTFIGTLPGTVDLGYITCSTTNMMAFTTSGATLWTVPNYQPVMATIDGGVIAVPPPLTPTEFCPQPLVNTATTFDTNGNAVGLASTATLSWTANTYQYGSVESVATVPPSPATPPNWSFDKANQSSSGTSPLCKDPRDQIVAQYGQYKVLDSFFALYFGKGPVNMKKWPRFTPNCFEFTRAAHSASFSFDKIATGNAWALVKWPLVAPATTGYGLDDWLAIYQQRYGATYGMSRTISSGYRTPAHNASLPLKTATSSRHMLGDAIDFLTAKHTIDELRAMNKAALLAEADFVEDPDVITTYCANPNPTKGRPPYPCAHADWRYHSKGAYMHGAGAE
jgi:trimeric autotransporter adhesin